MLLLKTSTASIFQHCQEAIYRYIPPVTGSYDTMTRGSPKRGVTHSSDTGLIFWPGSGNLGPCLCLCLFLRASHVHLTCPIELSVIWKLVGWKELRRGFESCSSAFDTHPCRGLIHVGDSSM